MSLPLSVIEEAESAVDKTRLTSTLRDLISIPSENPLGMEPCKGQGEEDVASYLAERLEPLGVRCEIRPLGPKRCNLVGKVGVGPGGLMMAGHLDTVGAIGYPEAYSADVRDGRIYGRGACDMKAALACYVEVSAVLQEVGISLDAPLYVVGVADEEYAMSGAREIGRVGPWVDGVIVGEPTGLAVCPASKGRVSTFIVARGRAAHSSVPETGVNAITHMGKVLNLLERHAKTLREDSKSHPLLGEPRINPGVVSGGTQVNVVPDECRLEVDRRTLPGETKESVYEELGALLAEVTSGTDGFDAHLTEPSWLIPANETPTDHPLVATLLDAGRQVLGKNCEPGGFVAGSDAAFYGSPAVICGPGSLEQAHTTNEYVATGELVDATRIYLRVVLELLVNTGGGKSSL